MRFLFVGTSKTGGGTETHFSTLAIALTKLGHEVAAVVRPGSPIEQALKGSKVRTYKGIFRNSLDIRGIKAVTGAAREFRPDWIVGSFSKEYWPLLYVSKRMQIPLALFRHMATAMKRGTQYFIPRLADRFVVISDYMRELFVGRGVPEDRIWVLHNPLDLARYRQDPDLRKNTREDLGIAEDQLLVGYIGALHPGKGIYVLLEALKKVLRQNPRFRALWIGTGVDRARFKHMLAGTEHSDRHIFKGYIEDVLPYLNALDMLILPSTEPDTFGRVLIEAQACGVPVIATNMGGLPEALLPGKTGILVEPNDVDQLAEAIGSLLERSDLILFKNKGKQFVKQGFKDTIIAQKFISLLDQENPRQWKSLFKNRPAR